MQHGKFYYGSEDKQRDKEDEGNETEEGTFFEEMQVILLFLF